MWFSSIILTCFTVTVRMPFDQTTSIGFWVSYAIECFGFNIGTVCMATGITLFLSICYYLMACISVMETMLTRIDETIISKCNKKSDKVINKLVQPVNKKLTLKKSPRPPIESQHPITKMLIDIINFHDKINRYNCFHIITNIEFDPK